MITEYWKKNAKKAKTFGRVSDTRAVASAVKKRKQSPTVSEPESVETVKKRGRPPKAKSVSDDEDVEELPVSKSKAARKNLSGANKLRKESREEYEEEETYVDMKKWKDAASWAHLVDHIDTVERMKDGKLYVYFRLCVSCPVVP